MREKKTARSGGLGRGKWSHCWTRNSIYLFINLDLEDLFSTHSLSKCEPFIFLKMWSKETYQPVGKMQILQSISVWRIQTCCKNALSQSQSRSIWTPPDATGRTCNWQITQALLYPTFLTPPPSSTPLPRTLCGITWSFYQRQDDLMNIHVADTAGDTPEFAELSAEKSPLCGKHAWWASLSLSFTPADPPACPILVLTICMCIHVYMSWLVDTGVDMFYIFPSRRPLVKKLGQNTCHPKRMHNLV